MVKNTRHDWVKEVCYKYTITELELVSEDWCNLKKLWGHLWILKNVWYIIIMVKISFAHCQLYIMNPMNGKCNNSGCWWTNINQFLTLTRLPSILSSLSIWNHNTRYNSTYSAFCVEQKSILRYISFILSQQEVHILFVVLY